MPFAANTSSEFARRVGGTLATRAVLLCLTLLTSVIIARALGPAGRGEYAVAVAVSAIGVQFANLGLHTSNSLAVAREPRLLGRLLANSLLATLAVVGAGGLVAWGILSVVAPVAAPLPGPLLALTLLSIPFGLVYLHAQNLFLGLRWIKAFNLVELARVAGLLALLGVLVLAGWVSVLTAFVGFVIALVFVVVISLAALRHRAAESLRPSLAVLREYGRYGLRAYIAALFMYVVLRVDLLMVQYLRGAEEAGQYSIAVGLAEVLYLFPIVVATVLFPTLSAMSVRASQWETARSVAIRVSLATVFLAAVAAVLAGPAIDVLYGREFLPAIPAFMWLLPGVVLLSIHTIFMNYYSAIGTPAIAIVAPMVGAMLSIGLNLILIPAFGIVGASAASTASYGLMLLVSSSDFYLRRANAATA